MLTESGPLGARFGVSNSGVRTASRHPDAVEEQISGEPLDRAAEIAARKQQWQAAGP